MSTGSSQVGSVLSPPCQYISYWHYKYSIYLIMVAVTGLGCTTVVYPESAALAAAQIHALHDHIIWSRLRVKQLNNFIALKVADKMIRHFSTN